VYAVLLVCCLCRLCVVSRLLTQAGQDGLDRLLEQEVLVGGALYFHTAGAAATGAALEFAASSLGWRCLLQQPKGLPGCFNAGTHEAAVRHQDSMQSTLAHPMLCHAKELPNKPDGQQLSSTGAHAAAW